MHGQTLGRLKKTAGISYVAIRQVKTVSSCVVEPMTFEKFTGRKISNHFKLTGEEEKRPDKLAKSIW